MREVLLLKNYYGVNIHGDAHGDFGIFEYSVNCFADLIFLTAATIADECKDINLHVVDGNAERILPDEMVKKLHTSYDYIIVKSAAPIVSLDLKFMEELREIYPSAKLLFAGHVAKVLKNWIEGNATYIDMVIEKPLDTFMYEFAGMEGEPILENFPSPNYELLGYKNFMGYDGKLRLSLQMSRGCSMKCGYCPYNAFYESKMEFRNVDKVIEDIKKVLKYNPSVIQFRDQYFTANKKMVKELCQKIKDNHLDFKWTCETRIDDVDEELVDIMSASGLQMMCFGVESAEEDILDEFGRKIVSSDSLKKKIEYINNKGVDTLGFYIVGFPNDTWESTKKTLEQAIELDTTYTKFSVYEKCVLESNELEKLTPEVFERYQNLVNIEDGSILAREEKVYLANIYSILYCISSDSLEASYKVVYNNITNYQNLLSKLLPLGTDLDAICEAVRTYRKNGENEL